MITVQKNQQAKPFVIVAGGAGFIGSFLCEALLLQGCQIICIDDLSSGKKENLKKCLANPSFTFIHQDLKKSFSLDLPEKKFYVFDLTGLAIVRRNLTDFLQKFDARILVLNPRAKELNPDENLRFVFVDNVYGPRMNLESKNSFVQLIKSAVLDPKVKVFPETIQNFSPVFISDVVYGLIKIMFGTTNAKIIKLAPNEKIKWLPKVSFPEGLVQTRKYFQKEKKIKKFPKFLILAIFVLLMLISPFLNLGLNLYFGVNYLKAAQKAVVNGDFKKAKEKAYLGRDFFRRGVNFSQNLQIFGDIFKLGQDSAEALVNASSIAQNSKLVFGDVFQNQPAINNQNFVLDNLIAQMKVDLDQLLLNLSLIEMGIKSNKSINFLKQFNVDFPQTRSLIIQAKKSIDLLPVLIGKDKTRTYLVLMQNSAELRPTGGFIGSYAILSFNKGKFIGLEVKNVYEADGQLKGHVEPPPALKKHLGEANWYLRDSNWSPDFPTTAQRASWFLEKETGQTVDGVIGINLYLAQRLLSVFGEVNLPDYQEKINANNLFEKAGYYSEVKFFPGSTQKEDFLGSLSRFLFEKIKTADKKTILKLSTAIFDSLKARDLTVYLNDDAAAKIISDLDWDGGIKNDNFFDYLMIVEANLGVNKANYFVKRNLSHLVSLDSEGIISEKLKIVYQNNSSSEIFPAGNYKNYLRILTPVDSELKGVEIDGEPIEKTLVDEEMISGKKAFGILVEVPIKTKRTIEISYQLGQKLSLAKIGQYTFYLQKQSGIKDEKFELEFMPAVEIAVSSASPPAITNGQKYQFESKFDSDLVFELQLVK